MAQHPDDDQQPGTPSPAPAATPGAAPQAAPAATTGPTVASDPLPEQLRVRRGKRERMLDAGVEPYPIAVPRTDSLLEIRTRHPEGSLAAGEETDELVSVTGRVVFARNSGKLAFANLQEGDGTRLQVMLSLAEVGEEALAGWKADVDLGDHVSVSGRVAASRRGELSVMATSWAMASKALRPLPNLYENSAGEAAGLTEEARVRQRYADLIVRPEARANARRRSAVVRSLRETFHRHDFLEVETPMLQTLHGGAAARPFVTRSNALDVDLFLRIAPELFLKRAVVGGLERVFEINRNFRNEGADSTHSPEFAMLEFYQAYTDYDGVADLTRELVQTAAREATGGEVVTLVDGSEYDLGGEWAKIEMFPSLSGALGEEITPATPLAVLRGHVERLGLQVAPSAVHGKLVEELWEHLVGDHLVAPTFVRDFPLDTSPLTKAHRSVEGVVEKWDLVVRGFELATGYSELNDPVVQRERLEAQARLGAAGDDEAMALDEDFLRAMEHGMPPAGGVGIGVDRLLMALTGLGIRETILFPLVRPQPGS